MIHKGIQIKFKQDLAAGFINMVDEMHHKCLAKDDDDKLMLAGLTEIKHRMAVKLMRPQGEYIMTLTPVQSLAIAVLYKGYIQAPTGYVQTKLMQWSNATDQRFAQAVKHY